MVILRENKFEEKLERATQQQFDLLQQQIDSNPETAKMLTPMMRDVPQYQWLWSGYQGGHSLFDAMRFIVLFEDKYDLFAVGFNTPPLCGGSIMATLKIHGSKPHMYKKFPLQKKIPRRSAAGIFYFFQNPDQYSQDS